MADGGNERLRRTLVGPTITSKSSMTIAARSWIPAVFFVLLSASAGFPSIARAQANVLVEVRAIDGGARDATVTLTPSGAGEAYSCQTHGGSCRIGGVREGVYIVTAAPLGPGRSPLPRSVPITPSGEVRIIITLR